MKPNEYLLSKIASEGYDPLIDGLLTGRIETYDIHHGDNEKLYNDNILKDKNYYYKIENAKKVNDRLAMGEDTDKYHKRRSETKKTFKDKIGNFFDGPRDKYMGLDDFGNDEHIKILNELKPHISEEAYNKHHEFIMKSIKQKADSIKNKKVGSFIDRLQGYQPIYLTDAEIDYFGKHGGALDDDVVKQNKIHKEFKENISDNYGLKRLMYGHNVAGLGIGALGIGSVLNKKFNKDEDLNREDAAMLGGSALALGGAGYGSFINKKYDNKYEEKYNEMNKVKEIIKDLKKQGPKSGDLAFAAAQNGKKIEELENQIDVLRDKTNKQLKANQGNQDAINKIISEHKVNEKALDDEIRKMYKANASIEEKQGMLKEIREHYKELRKIQKETRNLSDDLDLHKKITAGTIGAGALLTAGGYLYNKFNKRNKDDRLH